MQNTSRLLITNNSCNVKIIVSVRPHACIARQFLMENRTFQIIEEGHEGNPMKYQSEVTASKKLSGKPSAFGIWGLSFGCVIGWGCIVMPGTTFLPDAGPLGSVIGHLAAALMILVVCMNYSVLARRFPDCKGTYGYIRKVLGNDYAFLSAWSLVISYLMLFWANSTAFMLIGRYFFGGVLQWGLHYTIAGYDVYMGEIIATIIVEAVCCFILLCTKKTVYILRIILAAVLFISVMILFAGTVLRGEVQIPAPAFASGGSKGLQVLSVAVLAPWLYVGFETVYHEAGTEHYSLRGTIIGTVASVAAGMLVYTFLSLIAVSGLPEGVESWKVYVDNLGQFEGLSGVPVLFNIQRMFGTKGTILAAIAVFSALSTGVLGFLQSAANLVQTMSKDRLLPGSFSAESGGVPRRAVMAILFLSLPIPFFGRTSIGWLVDVSTLAVAIVYAHISISTLRTSRQEHRVMGCVTGAAGAMLSAAAFIFLIIPNIFLQNALTTETYFMLAVWSLTGIIYYWIIFRQDTENRFGKSTVMWIVMLALLFLSVILWISMDTQNRAPGMNKSELSSLLTRNSILEVGLMAVMILVIFNLFSTMLRREHKLDRDRILAEEGSRAKSVFLFNMSHDIRTPLNAIIGYTSLATQEKDVPPVIADYLTKIEASGHHLLYLINDVLEMSRIESGKMELEPGPMDLKKAVSETEDIFAAQMKAKSLEFTVDTTQIKDRAVLCDKNRLVRVLLNLLSNACKFTPAGGRVSLTLCQTGSENDQIGSYEIRVKDNGIGMSREFAARVFEAFERERTSTVSNIQGTGLGMAITKGIVDLMGGTIRVDTEPGAGTEVIIDLDFELVDEALVADEASEKGKVGISDYDFSKTNLLLVEDNEINREIATAILVETGFSLETAENGQEAVDMVSASRPGHFDLILMDVQMPVMDGYEATRAIRALADPALAGIPIVAMTANAFAEDIQAAKDAGMNAHIAKPIDISVMIETIAGVLRG